MVRTRDPVVALRSSLKTHIKGHSGHGRANILSLLNQIWNYSIGDAFEDSRLRYFARYRKILLL